MRRRRTCATCLTVLWIGLLVGATPGLLHAEGSVAGGELIRLNDDGGWCWFQGERAIVHDGRLLVGSVAAGAHDPERKGDVELTVYDPADDRARRITLHEGLGLDDHNTPALLARQDGRLLAVWAAHGSENRFYYRLTTGEGPVHWGERRRFIPSESSRITYSNVFQLGEEDGRVYNFYRGLDDSFKPSYAYSDEGGRSWNSGSIVIDVPTEFRHRPYVKYASNGTDAIHLLYTEGHPRKYDNSVYHVVYRAGKLRSSDGKPLAPLSEGLDRPEEGTRVFEGDADRVAWTSDLHLDAEGRPYAAFSV
jgi:hypothetical protein